MNWSFSFRRVKETREIMCQRYWTSGWICRMVCTFHGSICLFIVGSKHFSSHSYINIRLYSVSNAELCSWLVTIPFFKTFSSLMLEWWQWRVYSTLTRAQKIEPIHQLQFSATFRILSNNYGNIIPLKLSITIVLYYHCKTNTSLLPKKSFWI